MRTVRYLEEVRQGSGETDDFEDAGEVRFKLLETQNETRAIDEHTKLVHLRVKRDQLGTWHVTKTEASAGGNASPVFTQSWVTADEAGADPVALAESVAKVGARDNCHFLVSVELDASETAGRETGKMGDEEKTSTT